MRGGPLLRHEVSLAGDPLLAEVQRLAARLRTEKTQRVDRLGVPDQVRVKVHATDATGRLVLTDIWEADFRKLAANDVLADTLRVVRAVASAAQKRSPARPVTPEEAGARWPYLFASRTK